MSEHDYQRGLRGGDCNVSIRDWERWEDWKAGRDAYEAQLEAQAEAALTPAQQSACRQERIRERKVRELRDKELEAEMNAEKRESERKSEAADRNGLIIIFGGILVGAAVGCSLIGWIGLLGGFVGFVVGGFVFVLIYGKA